MSRFAKRGNNIQLDPSRSQTLSVSRSPDGRHPEDGLYSEQGSFLYCHGASLSLTVCLLSYGPPPSISLTQPFTHHSISCDPETIANRRHQTFSTFRGPNRFTTSFEVGSL